MRHIYSQKIDAVATVKSKIFSFACRHNVCAYLDNNFYQSYQYGTYELLVAIDHLTAISASNDDDDLKKLSSFLSNTSDWKFGFFSYNIKNKFHQLSSIHPGHISFPDYFFFVPKYILYIPKNSKEIFIESTHNDGQELLKEILQFNEEIKTNAVQNVSKKNFFNPSISKENYVEKIQKIQECIAKGDFYELNFCMEYTLDDIALDFPILFQKLNQINKAPFSAFFRNEALNIACTSPERFLMKNKNKLMAQPIKGTHKKMQTDEANRNAMEHLKNNIKERAENVMIVDLTRNDLAHFCKTGSVAVEELCKVYSFEHVHHLVSTISGQAADPILPLDIFRATFPPGSMTGAPKIMVMKQIEAFENFNRGLYSGSIGYFHPNGDFDFNVVIRSIFYHAQLQKMSCHTGSAITFDAIAATEYEECLAKAEAMFQAVL